MPNKLKSDLTARQLRSLQWAWNSVYLDNMPIRIKEVLLERGYILEDWYEDEDTRSQAFLAITTHVEEAKTCLLADDWHAAYRALDAAKVAENRALRRCWRLTEAGKRRAEESA